MKVKLKLCSRQSLRIWVCTATLILLVGCGRRDGRPEPMPVRIQSTQVAEVTRFYRFDTNESLGEGFEVGQHEGFYAVLEFRRDKGAVQLGDRELSDVKYWPCVAISYPEGSERTASDSVHFATFALRPDAFADMRLVPVLAPPGPQCNLPQFKGGMALSLPKSEQLGVIVSSDLQGPVISEQIHKDRALHWTFLGPTHEKPGVYVLEIHTFPTFSGRAEDVATSLGESVILLRTRFSILAK